MTVDRALRYDFTPGLRSGVTARQLLPVQNAGIENLALENPFGQGFTWTQNVRLEVAANIWIDGLVSRWATKQHVFLKDATNITLTNSYIGEIMHNYCGTPGIWSPPPNDCGSPPANQSGPGNEGVYLEAGSQDSLFVNNHLEHHNNNVVFWNGANGHVFAYNWIGDPGPASQYWANGIFFHGFWPYENLIEGNDSENNITTDSFWGQNGPNNTFYRNRLRGNTTTMCTPAGPSGCGMLFTNLDKAPPAWNVPYTSTYQTVIGNIFWGACRRMGTYYNTGGASSLTGFTDHLWLERNIARDPRGIEAGGSGKFGLVLDNLLGNTSCGTREGDCVGGIRNSYGNNTEGERAPAQWPDGVSHEELDVPASLFFFSRADWERKARATWCAEACDWDAKSGIGAFGDDFTQALCKLPAQIRAEGGTCGAR